MQLDRDFLYQLEKCNTRREIENVIEDCDDDGTNRVLTEHYHQILEFNKEETVMSIKKILIFVYRKYCSEN